MSTTSMTPPLRAPDSGKIASADEAVRLIHDGDTVATGGFVGIGFAEEIAVALEALYLSKLEKGERDRPHAGTQLVSGPVRFVLGASGHIAGVINPPAAKKYGYWTDENVPEDPEAWLEAATYHEGSWWNDWSQWIAEFGDGQVPPRTPGSGSLLAIEDAPGSFVKVRLA